MTEFRKMPEIRILTGVTAAGKTSVSLELAKARNAEILSCDTTCVYQGMDIGTAKPTAREQAAVPHHLIDLVPVREVFDVGRYVSAALEVLHDLARRGKTALVVGGSGFYLKAFFAAVTDEVEVSAEVRREVRVLEREGGREALVRRLRELHPEGDAFEGLDLANPRRISRALERCLASGESYGTLRRRFLRQKSPFADYPKTLWLLDCERAELERRIEKRVDAMLREGLIDEVEALDDAGIRGNPAAASAIGYREVLAYLAGELSSRAELREAIIVNTRRLAAKQRKWLRTQLPAPDKVIFK